MDNKENNQKIIDKFLEDNKIRVSGGQITDFKQLAFFLNKLSENEIRKGRFEKGLYFAEKSLEFDKENHSSLFLKGSALRYLGRIDESIEVLKEHYTICGDQASIMNIGFCYAQADENEKAIDYFNEALSSIKGDEYENYKELIGLVYECMGNIYLSREDILEFDSTDKLKMNYKLAIKYYKKSVSINKSNPTLLNRLAACYYHFDDMGKALYCYELAS
ncbi:MAG: hypothetical protein Q4F66_14550, partial [Clostridium sp.]|nr:hypothetical protein [Clostridium sp.]